MTIWVSSDTHYGHFNVIKYCDRPFLDVQEMEEVLINNWNRLIKPEDIVYHLGDFAFASLTKIYELIQKLNGTKILIKGNHDKHKLPKYVEAGFSEAIGEKVVRYKDKVFYMRHKWSPDPVIFHHYFLHGHSHSKPEEIRHGKKLDIGVDGHNYSPWSLDEIIEYMKDEG